MRLSRFLVAAGALGAGILLVWFSGAVPALQGAASGSALDSGPAGMSQLAQDLRAKGVLASTVRIDNTANGLGLSPTPWDQWNLKPQDAVLTVRSDVALQPAEFAAARAWLEGGGHLVVVANSNAELTIASQLVGTRVPGQPMRDGAFVGEPERPVVPDGAFRYQLDGALAVSGPLPVIASAGLAWTSADEPSGPDALRPYAFATRYPIGSGSILVVGDSHPLENGGRDELDNERLARRIVDELASGGGAVFIDEGHRSGGVPVRVDLALRAIGPTGRIAIGLLFVLATATALFPWPSRLVAAARRHMPRRKAEEATDPVAEVQARHPDWDPRLLARLAGGRP